MFNASLVNYCQNISHFFWRLGNLTNIHKPMRLPWDSDKLFLHHLLLLHMQWTRTAKCLDLVRIWPLWVRSRKCHQYPSVSATTWKHLFSYCFTPETISFVGMPGWSSKPSSHSGSALHSVVFLGLHLKHLFGSNQYPFLRFYNWQHT